MISEKRLRVNKLAGIFTACLCFGKDGSKDERQKETK